MYRKLPKAVKQKATWSCWAAGLESWLAAAPFGRKATQQELIDEYATDSKGGLDPISAGATAHRDFQTLASDFAIKFVVKRGKTLTEDFLDGKLKQGYVLLIYNLAPNVAHTHVVYGIGYPQGNERRVSVMDPSTGGYTNKPIEYYHKRRAGIVGWP